MEKRFLLTIVVIVILNSVLAQKKNGSIEINPYVRYDVYANFLSINESYLKISTKLKGTSTGININYKFSTKSNYQLFAGIGYYKNTFNNITSGRPSSTNTTSRREILIVRTNYISTFTDNYWYNNVAFNVGFDKHLLLKNNSYITIGAIMNNFIEYSQYYYFEGGYVEGKNHLYTKNTSYGISTSIQVGFLKKISKFSIGPKLIIPVFDNKKKDKNFPYGIGTGVKDKWLNGIGLGISLNYLLTK